MKPLHTEGEWTAKDGQIYSQETGKTLALIPYFDEDSEEQKANQALMAAAQNLFDAAKSAIETLEQMVQDDMIKGMKMVLEQAINKATNQ